MHVCVFIRESERERDGLSVARGGEFRALGALPTPCGEVCAREAGTKASAAAFSSPNTQT